MTNELGKDFKRVAGGFKFAAYPFLEAPRSKYILQGLPNTGLELNKRRPRHMIQGRFAKASATLYNVACSRCKGRHCALLHVSHTRKSCVHHIIIV